MMTEMSLGSLQARLEYSSAVVRGELALVPPSVMEQAKKRSALILTTCSGVPLKVGSALSRANLAAQS